MRPQPSIDASGSASALGRVAPGLEPLLRPVADLRLDPANARAHSERNVQAIADSLARFGQQKPHVVITSDGVVVAGNGTLEAARLLGWTQIACVTTDLEGGDVRGFAIADNRTAELAEWDVDPIGLGASGPAARRVPHPRLR